MMDRMRGMKRGLLTGIGLAFVIMLGMAADREDYSITWLRVKNIKKLGSNASVTFDDPTTFTGLATFNGGITPTFTVITNAGGEGRLTIYGGETNAAGLYLYPDNGDDANDKVSLYVSTADLFSVRFNAVDKFTLSSGGDIGVIGGDITANGVSTDYGEGTTNVFAITASAGVTTSAGLTVGTDLTVSGGDIAGKTGTGFDMGEAAAGTLALAGTNIALNAAGGAITVGDGDGTVAVNSGDWDISTTGDGTGIGSWTMNGLLVETPTAISVTNTHARTVAASVYVCTPILSADTFTNTMTLANPTAAGQRVTFIVATTVTNVLGIADSGNCALAGAFVGNGNDSISLVAASTSLWVEDGRSAN